MEGFHLIEEAASSDAEIKEIFVTQKRVRRMGRLAGRKQRDFYFSSFG
ncbi:hypothetical protein LOS20_13385 [Enterococcus faecium]|nr:hypothetical protein [Enterococcus faecium]